MVERLNLNQILIFVRVVQAGGFSAAARQMGVPKSTVSRKVAELEARLGARLLQRTSRKQGLTDAGRVYYGRVRSVVSELEEAEHAVGRLQAAPRGLLRVTAPPAFATLGAIATEYLERYPDVQLELVCTDRRVDLIEERFDVAVRAGALVDSTLMARKLGLASTVLVAAPRYCKHHGTPETPAELRPHACIAFGVGDAPDTWVLESAGKRVEVRIRPRLTVNHLETLHEAAIAGLGVACLPEMLCADDLRKKRLRRLLPHWSAGLVPVHALFPSTHLLSPKVVAFLELLATRLREAPFAEGFTAPRSVNLPRSDS